MVASYWLRRTAAFARLRPHRRGGSGFLLSAYCDDATPGARRRLDGVGR
ncbi:MAG: hypothetical protein AVDCRST_MAG49-4188 [uncultured Thermomicrobiales bacterium]|uniref:Uncharacterized protein n=1 Tax=uncultured Thermomicrobiales bacterium TaxID=1645740 RepID=A0A6J4VKP9_9BACT|nr:MAG: hypothetical protein AVDCRST_MAG49-4188 [uncultured Thermomicrobiales bacterium]